MPKLQDFAKEAAILIGGAILAAAIMGQLPQVRNWIKAQWGDADRKI